MITSPAVRALTTCQAFATILNFDHSKIKTPKELYHASADEILTIVQGAADFPDDEDVMLIFGHNPGLTDFVNEILTQPINNLPTTGIAALTLNVNQWKEVQWKSGQLLFFDFPKLHHR